MFGYKSQPSHTFRAEKPCMAAGILLYLSGGGAGEHCRGTGGLNLKCLAVHFQSCALHSWQMALLPLFATTNLIGQIFSPEKYSDSPEIGEFLRWSSQRTVPRELSHCCLLRQGIVQSQWRSYLICTLQHFTFWYLSNISKKFGGPPKPERLFLTVID